MSKLPTGQNLQTSVSLQPPSVSSYGSNAQPRSVSDVPAATAAASPPINVEDAFEILEHKYHGNFLDLPFEDNLKFRKAMRQAIRDRKRMALAIRNLCKLDLFFLSHSILGYVDTIPQVHRPYADHLIKYPHKAVLMMPRGYFKSSVGTISRSVQIALNDPSRRILIANAGATLAEKFVRKIGTCFTDNKQIRELFPELIPKNFKKVKWCDNAIELARPNRFVEATFEAIGVGGTSVGRHYTDIFLDDLVNEDHIASISQMDKTIEWYKLICGSLGVKGSFNAIHNATRWSYYDVISWVIENEPEFAVFHLSCYDENNESTFPQIYPTEELRRLEVVKGPSTFAAQFLNDPIPAGSQIFKPEWIRYYKELPDCPLRFYMLVDPAISEGKTACQRVVLVVAVDEDFNWYVVDYTANFNTLIDEDNPSLVGDIFRLYSMYKPWFVGIEEIGFQKALSYLLYREMKSRRCHFVITPMKPERLQTKEMRIETLAAPFGSGKVFMKEEHKELYKQLVGYPAYRYKDVVDALSYMMQYGWETSKIELEKPMVENSLRDIHARIEESRRSRLVRRTDCRKHSMTA